MYVIYVVSQEIGIDTRHLMGISRLYGVIVPREILRIPQGSRQYGTFSTPKPRLCS